VPLQSPTWADVIQGAIDARLGDVHTALPGRVESFNKTTQRASVQALVRRPYYDENGDRQTERIPVFQDVPVMFPGSGKNRMTTPVKSGDLVLLVFASASLDLVLSQGVETDPKDDRRHSLSDAIAIPGFYTFTSLPTTAPDDAVVIHAEDEVRLGGPGANKALTRATDVENAIKGLFSDTAFLAALAAIPVNGTAPVTAAVNAYFVAHPASGAPKVKAE